MAIERDRSRRGADFIAGLSFIFLLCSPIYGCDSSKDRCPKCPQCERMECGDGTILDGAICVANVSEKELSELRNDLSYYQGRTKQNLLDLEKARGEAKAIGEALVEATRLSATEQGGKQKAEKELTQCLQDLSTANEEAEKLRNGPQELLKSGLAALGAGDRQEASKVFQRIVAEYPSTSEKGIAETRIAEIQKSIQQEEEKARKEEAERLRKLREGFKKVKIYRKTIKIGDLEIQSPKVTVNQKWRFDRYAYSWFERTADKGSRYLSLDYTVNSNSKNPDLPRIVAFIVEDGRGRQLADLSTMFYRWSDYGSYLGNYSDPKNDFAKTSSIKFTSGAQISDEYLKKHAVFVAITQDLCLRRKYERFEQPPVSYVWSKCDSIPYRFGPEYLDKLHVVYIHNKRALK